MTYDSESEGSDKSSNNATDTEEEAWKNGCRDLIIIDKLTNSTSNIKEHKLSSNNLDTELHDAHLLNTLCKPSIMVKQTKSKKEIETQTFQSDNFCQTGHSSRQEGQTVQDSSS